MSVEEAADQKLLAAKSEITQLQTLLAESNRLNGALMVQVPNLSQWGLAHSLILIQTLPSR